MGNRFGDQGSAGCYDPKVPRYDEGFKLIQNEDRDRPWRAADKKRRAVA
ncbi:hypothetical protein SPHINGO361_130061 [Sphingomonas sp. EC-HK361]|nr:hypothetical protein SPHINGO361_130061 [Sphingomonas sp. EC-HK361]